MRGGIGTVRIYTLLGPGADWVVWLTNWDSRFRIVVANFDRARIWCPFQNRMNGITANSVARNAKIVDAHWNGRRPYIWIGGKMRIPHYQEKRKRQTLVVNNGKIVAMIFPIEENCMKRNELHPNNKLTAKTLACQRRGGIYTVWIGEISKRRQIHNEKRYEERENATHGSDPGMHGMQRGPCIDKTPNREQDSRHHCGVQSRLGSNSLHITTVVQFKN